MHDGYESHIWNLQHIAFHHSLGQKHACLTCNCLDITNRPKLRPNARLRVCLRPERAFGNYITVFAQVGALSFFRILTFHYCILLL